MQFSFVFATLAVCITTACAAATNNLESRKSIADPLNPANFINCPPHGGADACNLEQPCNRIRINYGSRQGGHFIWYNSDIGNVPKGITVGTEASCTDA
ncbi:hypothetical protein L218DRAFT_1007971 [Marasmius fiardii PR-910]|nr:hypothetical protein L218DRAFT_1007970 [Marasmius fiardii PR-910]KAF9255937.1 hypothetical protein L218DRAFT_1007971 [Marasmius fiardii PR-910]